MCVCTQVCTAGLCAIQCEWHLHRGYMLHSSGPAYAPVWFLVTCAVVMQIWVLVAPADGCARSYQRNPQSVLSVGVCPGGTYRYPSGALCYTSVGPACSTARFLPCLNAYWGCHVSYVASLSRALVVADALQCPADKPFTPTAADMFCKCGVGSCCAVLCCVQHG
jgi:hypothetical protein